jgi:hypothetical protein
VTGVTASDYPTNATGAQTGVNIGLTATSALEGVDGSTVTVTFPSTISLSALESFSCGVCAQSSIVTDTTTSEQVGTLTLSGVVSQTATFTISSGQVVNPGDALHVWVGGITNPPTVSPLPTISVSTSSDPRPVQSGALAIAAAKSVSGVSITNIGGVSGTGSTTSYSVQFTTSSTGGLASTVGSTITVTFPTGFNTSPPISCFSGCDVITDVNSGEVVGNLSGSGTKVTGTVIVGFGQQPSINAGDTLRLTMVGVVNSTTASAADTVSVMTSSDDASAVKSNSFSVIASHPAGTPTLAISPTAAAGALAGYAATFALSSTGGLSGSNGSSVTVNLPTSATVTFPSASLFNQTTGRVISSGSQSISGTSVTIPLAAGAVANPGDVIAATVDGVANPATAGSYSVTVQTSSDTKSPASNAVAVVAQKSVSAVTVKNTGPTSAAGARTGYAVSFTTSSTGSLSAQVGSTVTVAFPTGFEVFASSSSLIDTTTGQVVGAFSSAGSSAEAFLDPGVVVQGGDTLTGYIEGVTNSTSTSTTDTVSISTSSDKPATSGTFSVTAASPVTSVTNVLAGPTDAAGAATGYKVTFKTPTSGGLSPTVGSSVTVGLPSGFMSGNNGSWTILDKTTNTVVGSGSFPGGPLTLSSPVTGGDTLVVTLHDVIDGSTPGTANKFSVSTTSSPSVVTASSGVTVVAAQPVLTVTVTNNGPSGAAGAQTNYTVSFRTSSTGALSPADAGTVTITFPFPIASDFFSESGYTVVDTSSGRTVAQCSFSVSCSQFWSSGTPIPVTGSVAAGDTLVATIDAVKNGPASTTDKVSVSTSSDPTPATSLAFKVTAASAVSHPTVSVAPSSAGGALTGWTVRFTTSSTGGLTGAAQSSVTLNLPSGVSVCSQFRGAELVDTTTGTTVGTEGFCAYPNAVDIVLGAATVVRAGDALAVYLQGVVNPANPQTYHVGVQTSSDTNQVVSGTFTVVAPNTVSTPKLSMTMATHGALSVYTLTFATSKTGGLSARVGSAVNLILPPATGTSGASWSLTDVTSGNHVGSGGLGQSFGGSTQNVLQLQGSVAAGDTLQLVLNNVTNPTAGAYTLTVSTTSDWYDVPTAAYTIS